MLPSESKKLRIAIVGGGIGGLTLAVALSRLALDERVQVDIYESTAELTQMGAGITLCPRGWEIIKDLSLDKDLAGRLAPGETSPDCKDLKLCFVLRKSDQKQGEPIVDIMMRGAVSFHRADIQEVLLKHVSPTMKPHLSHRLSTYTETKDGIELEFTNGTKAVCDILVGADGINSVVRRVFLSKEKGIDPSSEEAVKMSQPVWSGTMVYRSLVDSEVIRKVNPDHPALSTRVVYCGKNKHIVAYPISQGKLVNIVPFVTDLQRENTELEGPPMLAETTDNITSLFEGWEEDAQCLVTNMQKPSRWAIQTSRMLDKYASGRVVLLGDSAHAMTPHLGNGAGQAMEDAWILANLINKAIRQEASSMCRITDVYSETRTSFVNWVTSLSREQGLRYELLGAESESVQEGDVVPAEKLTELGRIIERDWEWTWKTSPCDDLQKALLMLDQYNEDNNSQDKSEVPKFALARGNQLINVIPAIWRRLQQQLLKSVGWSSSEF